MCGGLRRNSSHFEKRSAEGLKRAKLLLRAFRSIRIWVFYSGFLTKF